MNHHQHTKRRIRWTPKTAEVSARTRNERRAFHRSMPRYPTSPPPRARALRAPLPGLHAILRRFLAHLCPWH
jgi:hypothetical protein